MSPAHRAGRPGASGRHRAGGVGLLDAPPPVEEVSVPPKQAPVAERDRSVRSPKMFFVLAGVAAAAVVAAVVAFVKGDEGKSPVPKPSAAVTVSALVAAPVVKTRVGVIVDAATPGFAESAQRKLESAKLTFTGTVDDVPFGQYATTQVLVLTTDDAATALGRRTAAALGIPDGAVFFSDQPTAVADVLVVLAADYKP